MPKSTMPPDHTTAIAENDKRISVHEAVCAARYESIDEKLENGKQRFDRLDKHLSWLGIAVAFNTILTLLGPGVAAEFLKKMIGA